MQTSRTAAYRLLQRVRARGEAAFGDGRHGHPTKVRGPVREWLDAYCRGAPDASGRAVQAALRERFGLTVSVTHLNRVRATLGLSRRAPGVGENQDPPPPAEAGWQEGAGALILLAAASETGLLTTLEGALPVAIGDARLAHAAPLTRRMLVQTLLFLPAVGLHRPWELRGYTGDGLALLIGRCRAYGYRPVERFLAELAAQDGDAALTDALAAWTTTPWAKSTLADGDEGRPVSSFYIDSHRKAVYSDALIPRGPVARRGAVLGCRTLLLLHDGAGHPLLVTTHRGDLHLTVGTPPFLARDAGAAGAGRGHRLIIDREGMAAEFLSALSADGYAVVSVLRADQYTDLSSFTEVGPFSPLRYDRQGGVVREVASARYTLLCWPITTSALFWPHLTEPLRRSRRHVC